MKIGICTLCSSYNFGAFLQAYALQQKLKEFGLEVEFLNLKKIDFEKIIYLKNKSIKKVLYNLGQVKKFEDDSKKLNIAKKRYNKEIYDAIIVGSDELWNVKNQSFKHYDEYFGINLNSQNIIAYAPSCNNIIPENLIKYNSKYDFKQFSFLSGRDENTVNLIEKISGRKAELVLDPTFLIDDYNKYIVYNNNENYIAVYGYSFTNEQISQIKEFASRRGLKLFSLGLYNSWCDRNIKMNAFEFLGYLKNASYIFTSTFHGTIFSIILEKNFVTFSNNSSKIKFLLEEFELKEIDFTNKNINEENLEKIDYIKINKIKEKYKESSLNYLKNALKI